MAQIVGTSGAWKDVLKLLKMLGVKIAHPQELQLKIKALEQNYEKLQKDFEREVQNLKNVIQKREFTLKNDIATIKESAQNAIQKLDHLIVQIKEESERNYEHAISRLREEFEQELRDLRNTVQKQESTLESDIKAITESAQQSIQKLSHQLVRIEKEMVNDVQFFDEKIIQIKQLYENNIKELNAQLAYKPQDFYRTIERLNNEITFKSERFLNRVEDFKFEIRTEIYNLKEKREFFRKLLILLKILKIKMAQWKFLFVGKSDIAELKIRKKEVLRTEENRLIHIKRTKFEVEQRKVEDISKISAEKSRKIRDNEQQIKDIKNRQSFVQIKEQKDIERIRVTLNNNREKLQYFEHNRSEIMAKRRQHIDRVTADSKEKRIKYVKNQQYSIQSKEIENIQKLHTTLDNYRQKLQYLEQNKPAVMAKRRQFLDDEIESLKKIMFSKEWKGAITELEVIESLRYLPNTFYVLNDVHLRISPPIYVQKKAVLSAQIDHLVITPAGIFVIETKHWSKQFVESGDFFDPYEQVTRASYLCYKLLELNFNKDVKTRSIVAYQGYLPKKKENDYIKVLKIQEVSKYILWFKSAIFSDNEMLKIGNFFKKNFL